jgi:hypothetical protein
MPEMLDLSKSPDAIATVEQAEKWGFDLKQVTGF